MPGKESATSSPIKKDPAKKHEVISSTSQGVFAPQDSASMTALQQAMAEPGKMRPAGVLALQRLGGNRAVTQLLANHTVQAKLSVGAANDTYEREADHVTAQVVNASASIPVAQRLENEDEIQAKPLAPTITTVLRREPASEEELQAKFIQRQTPAEEETLQANTIALGEAFSPGADFESQLAAARSGGEPLPDPTREFMEQRIGADFRGVKVHTDAQSKQLNRSIQAKAFTTGQDVFFGEGAYQPGSQGGRELIAHELTHVVQQAGTVQRHPHDPPQLDHGHYASNGEKTYTLRSVDDLNGKLREQLTIFKGTTLAPGKRFDTGYNGQGRGDVNEVVTLKTLETVIAGWKDLAVALLGVSPFRVREAYSFTDGQKTGKRMHDFLIEGNDNKTIFNFHIEVEGRKI